MTSWDPFATTEVRPCCALERSCGHHLPVLPLHATPRVSRATRVHVACFASAAVCAECGKPPTALCADACALFRLPGRGDASACGAA